MPVELRIKEIIKEKKIHQKDLAQQIGVSKVTVSYWCSLYVDPVSTHFIKCPVYL